MTKKKRIALIPAYKPDRLFLNTLKELHENGFTIVAVDDGSGIKYRDVFARAEEYATILRHKTNRGKGVALKTGLRFIRERFTPPYTVVTADADGQHLLDDILRVTGKAELYPDELVLGSRTLPPDAPFKSRFGNMLTNVHYKSVTHQKLIDTQTGLRAFSDRLVDRIIEAPGERYEYEMNMLLYLSRTAKFHEVPIEAVYINNNSASHFRPFKDTAIIHAQFVKYRFKK